MRGEYRPSSASWLRLSELLKEPEVLGAPLFGHFDADFAVPVLYSLFSGTPLCFDYCFNVERLLRPLPSPHRPLEGLLVLALHSRQPSPELQFDEKDRLLITEQQHIGQCTSTGSLEPTQQRFVQNDPVPVASKEAPQMKVAAGVKITLAKNSEWSPAEVFL